jgi:hypothetical protein
MSSPKLLFASTSFTTTPTSSGTRSSWGLRPVRQTCFVETIRRLRLLINQVIFSLISLTIETLILNWLLYIILSLGVSTGETPRLRILIEISWLSRLTLWKCQDFLDCWGLLFASVEIETRLRQIETPRLIGIILLGFYFINAFSFVSVLVTSKQSTFLFRAYPSSF